MMCSITSSEKWSVAKCAHDTRQKLSRIRTVLVIHQGCGKNQKFKEGWYSTWRPHQVADEEWPLRRTSLDNIKKELSSLIRLKNLKKTHEEIVKLYYDMHVVASMERNLVVGEMLCEVYEKANPKMERGKEEYDGQHRQRERPYNRNIDRISYRRRKEELLPEGLKLEVEAFVEEPDRSTITV